MRATLCHGLPPQFLLLFRSKFKKREEEFIQKQRKVHYRNSERYCDFSWTTMYKCAIQLHACFRLNHAVEILFQKRAENIQKSPKTCRRFLLSKMYGKIYRKALQDAVHLSCQKDVGKCIETFQNMLSLCFVKNVWKNEKKRLKICRRFVCSKTTGKMHRNVPKHAVVLFCQKREGNCTENF